MVRRRAELTALPVEQRRAVLLAPGGARRLAEAGMTWETLAGWLHGPMDAAAWAAIIPSMGYMARLRNLRNFDEADVPDEVIAPVLAQLADPEQVRRSRQLPFRFYSAYKSAPSLRWGHALEQALGHAVGNIPALGGRTLVLVDTSASMQAPLSGRSSVSRVEVGALFGVAFAARTRACDLVGFANGVFTHHLRPAASVLKQTQAFTERIGEVGHGTDIPGAVRAAYAGHERVVIVSDMQTIGSPGRGVSDLVPAHVPIYGFNLAGYAAGAMPTGSANRHEFGGLSDATWQMMALLESGRNADWPF
ncbi:TROVE domain-containing protein [Bailinhaonella thermotolerans]|uniref:TROVE domain-containing protein n=2 Tax=Bailinhaonella thermotolerans TaxID=1070861 RepID=A0A3A4AJT5_9ACTN|nr:TROVE domain-containing protein [Bailinhaonella thermotolerans]